MAGHRRATIVNRAVGIAAVRANVKTGTVKKGTVKKGIAMAAIAMSSNSTSAVALAVVPAIARMMNVPATTASAGMASADGHKVIIVTSLGARNVRVPSLSVRIGRIIIASAPSVIGRGDRTGVPRDLAAALAAVAAGAALSVGRTDRTG